MNMSKFINTLDYSLDLIKLRDVYNKTYRRIDFSFFLDNKEYTQQVINVTFNYAVKEYNKIDKYVYVKAGYNIRDLELEDCVCVQNGELVAIQIDNEVFSPISNSTLGSYFYYEDGVYKAKANISTVMSVADLRQNIYENGFICDGIKYVRFKRSAGSSRVGKCLFINEKLYFAMHRWEMCGLKVNEGDEVDLAALESYISLTLSSIIDTIEIEPESILVIDDYDSVFKEEVMATYLDNNENLKTEKKEVSIHNSIWDGQSLIQTEAMGKYSKYGMVLLRQRFFKSCCFNCNIQKWFKDNNITDISQLNGFTLAKDISEIKLITTPNSIKYLKFGTLRKWLREIDSMFGVVKHEKPTYFFNGRMVQTHYQLINTLPLTYDEVGELINPSLEYLKNIKLNPSVARYHIKYPDKPYFNNIPALSKNDIVYKMMCVNSNFVNTKLYRDWLRDLTQSYTNNLRKGKILVDGNYSTLLGNPIEMLQSSIGVFSGETQIGVGNIFSKNFEYDKTILGSRSPHVSSGNILLANNMYNKEIDTYFNITKEIVCINSINENTLERLSGCDFDSDTMLLTDNNILINAAKRIDGVFLVPTRLVEAQRTLKFYTNEDKADLDIKTSVNKIGEIINLSQELNSQYWNRFNSGESHNDLLELYSDISTLDVMSNMEIDKAKKLLPVNNVKELKKIKLKYTRKDKDGRAIRPKFFEPIVRDKGFYVKGSKSYTFHKTPMDYLQQHINKFRLPQYQTKAIPFSQVLYFEDYNYRNVKYEQVNSIVTIIRDTNAKTRAIWQDDNSNLSNKEKAMICSEIKENCVNYINSMVMSKNTMFYLLNLIEDQKYKDIRSLLMSVLFGTPNKSFYKFIKNSIEKIPYLKEVSDGNIWLYSVRFVEILPY